MTHVLVRLVNKLYAHFQAHDADRAEPAPHDFAKGEFAGRRRLNDR
jgi:hypothetical protein